VLDPLTNIISQINPQVNILYTYAKAAADTMEDKIKDMQSLNGFPIVFKRLLDEIHPFCISGSDGACEWERSELQARLDRK
jgi:hypothetical protein